MNGKKNDYHGPIWLHSELARYLHVATSRCFVSFEISTTFHRFDSIFYVLIFVIEILRARAQQTRAVRNRAVLAPGGFFLGGVGFYISISRPLKSIKRILGGEKRRWVVPEFRQEGEKFSIFNYFFF